MKRDKVKGGKKAIRDILRGRQKTKEQVKEEVELDESAGDAEFDAAYQQKLDAAHKGRTKQRAKAGVAPTGKDAEGQKKTEALANIFKNSRAASKETEDRKIVDAAKSYMPPMSAKSKTRGIEKPDHKPMGGGQNEFTTHLQNYAKTGDHAHYEKAKGVSASMYAQGLSDAHRYNGHHPEHHAQHKRDEKLAYQRRQQSLNAIHDIRNPKPGFFARVKKKLGFGEDSEVTDEEITNMLVETFLDGEEVDTPKYAFFQEGDVISAKFGGKPSTPNAGGATVHKFDSDEEKKDRFFKALTNKRPTPEQKAGWAAMKKRED